MRNDLTRRQDAHKRAGAVFAEHRDFFGATAGGTKQLTAFDASVTTVGGLLREQQRHLDDMRFFTQELVNGRRTLLDGLRTVVKVGALVKLEEGETRVMQMPQGKSDDLLVSASGAIVDKATANLDAFIAEGLPSTLLQEITSQIAAIDAAKAGRSRAQEEYTTATKSILAALDAGDKALAVLERMLKHASPAQPDIQTRLRIAKRVGPRVASEPAAAEPTPAPQPPAVETKTS